MLRTLQCCASAMKPPPFATVHRRILPFLPAAPARIGPVPKGRRMFEVHADETIALAATEGLKPVLNIHEQSKSEPNRSLGVTWTRMVFAR